MDIITIIIILQEKTNQTATNQTDTNQTATNQTEIIHHMEEMIIIIINH
jgi:flagellar basal body L-ring protein FlgH